MNDRRPLQCIFDKTRLSLMPLLVFLCLAGGNLVNAASIHKWVDARGITHYSDQPPPERVTGITEVEIADSNRAVAATNLPADNYYSIANQWQRMQREGQQRQQREIERARLKASRSQTDKTPMHSQQEDKRYVVVYRGRHRKHRGGYHGGFSSGQSQSGASLGAFPSIP